MTTLKRRENNKLQDLERQDGRGKRLRNPSKQIQSPTRHNGTKAEVCQIYCFTCVVLHTC